MINQKIWIGECNICKNITSEKCSNCKFEFYCSPEHEKLDKKKHKKECKKKINNLLSWKKDKILDFENDILKISALIFQKKYISYDEKLATSCLLPLLIMNNENKKSYFVQINDPDDPLNIIKKYEENGFTKENYYEINSLNKSSLYHNSIILSILELNIKYNIKLKFSGNIIIY